MHTRHQRQRQRQRLLQLRLNRSSQYPRHQLRRETRTGLARFIYLVRTAGIVAKVNTVSMAILLSMLSPVVALDVSAAVTPVRDIRQLVVTERQLLDAVASRTLSWLTGSASNNDYISIGRIANYFGFVGLRVASGQSVSRNRVAADTLAVLTPAQRAELALLLKTQLAPFEQTREARFEINRALERLLIGESVSKSTFLQLGREYGASEAELGRVLATTLGAVAQSLTPSQRTALTDIRAQHISGQADGMARQPLKLKMPKQDKKELVNIAARFLSWTTGSTEFNDFEVVGKPSQHFGFVSLRIDSNHGVKRGAVAKQVLSLLNDEQQGFLEAAAAHDARVFDEFLGARASVMRELEVALSGEMIDAAAVAAAGARIGELEAAMTWSQAMAMLRIRNSLSDAQSSALLSMRSRYTLSSAALPTTPVERGRQLFAQCVLCHDTAQSRAVAPALSGIPGRGIAADTDFSRYSDALQTLAGTERVWDEDLLSRFLQSPRKVAPGTFMGFDGLDSAQDREAIIAFLKYRSAQ